MEAKISIIPSASLEWSLQVSFSSSQGLVDYKESRPPTEKRNGKECVIWGIISPYGLISVIKIIKLEREREDLRIKERASCLAEGGFYRARGVRIAHTQAPLLTCRHPIWWLQPLHQPQLVEWASLHLFTYCHLLLVGDLQSSPYPLSKIGA